MDEKETLQPLIAEFRRLASYLEAFGKVRPGTPESLSELDVALRNLPNGETFGRATEELRAKIEAFLLEAKRQRSAAFGRIEASFLRNVREKQTSVREQNRGWRVGRLEIQTQPEQSQIRLLYNREVLIEWSPVQNEENIENLVSRALVILEKSVIPEATLVEAFWSAFVGTRELRRASGNVRAQSVPILEFYREVRIALVRNELGGPRLDKKLQGVDFPKWAFLYNLDRYRALGSSIPGEKRLGLQTGSQQEVAHNRGLVVNGLDALQDYKTMCHVVAVTDTLL